MQTRVLRFQYYMRRRRGFFFFRSGILLVLSFSINCNDAIGYGGRPQVHDPKPWKSSSLFIAAFALNYRSLFRESDSLWQSWLQWLSFWDVLVQRKWCHLFVPLLLLNDSKCPQRVLLTIIRYRINIVASILFPIPFGYYGPSSFLGLTEEVAAHVTLRLVHCY